jgi:hypothetical protein
MRCFILLVFLALPSAAIAADAAAVQSPAISSLTQKVQQLQEENEKLSARLSALEKRFPAPHQAITITTDHLDNPISVAPSPPHEHGKP